MFKSVLLICLLIAAVNASGVVVAPAVVPVVNYGYGGGLRGSYLRDRVISGYENNYGLTGYRGVVGYPGYFGYNGLGFNNLGYGRYLGLPYAAGYFA